MAFIKVHMSERSLEEAGSDLSEEIRRGFVETLGIRHEHGQVVLYGAPTHRRGVHESRNRNFIFVEILMFSGRSNQLKEELFRRLNSILHSHTGIGDRDIVFAVLEIDRNNWAIRGGVPMSKLDIGY